MRRSRVTALAGAGIVAAAILGWQAGRLIESPADAASRARPPEASPITVPVERKQLVVSIVTRGTGRAGDLQDVSLAAGTKGSGLVTVPPAQGTELGEGAVAMEVDGQPVFVLGGERPMYRDLTVGDAGPDVRQLEEALERLGLEPGGVDGTYDRATEAALGRLYERAGYTPPAASDEERQAARQAEEAVDQATARLREAERLLAERQKPPGELEWLTAETAVRAAREALGSGARTSNAAIAAAWEQLQEAETTFNSASGAEAQKAHQAYLAARRAYDNALASAESTRRQGEADLALAQAKLRAVGEPPEVASQQTAVRDAEGTVARAAAERDRLLGKSGPVLRASNVVFAASLPARVEAVHVQRGAAASAKVMTLATSTVSVDASVSVADARQLKVGQPAELGLPDGRTTAAAVVDAIADRPGTNGLDNQHVYVRLRPEGQPPGLKDAALRVSFELASTAGEVTVVPVAAVTTRADGASLVERLEADGRRSEVVVRLGVTADGFVEVAGGDGGLAPGDRVIVGENAGSRDI